MKYPFPEGHTRISPYTIRRDARRWTEKGKKDKSILYAGATLREAQKIAKEFPKQLNKSAIQFLRISDFEEKRGRRRLIISSCGVLLTVCVLTSWAIYQQAQTAIQAAGRTEQAATAQAQATTAAKALATARVESGVEESISRGLAAQATTLIRDKYDLGLLLSVEANNSYETVKSQRSLFNAIQTNPNLLEHLRKSDQSVKMLSFSPNGQIIGLLYEDGTIAFWNVVNRNYSILPSVKGKEIFFSPDSKFLAIASIDSGVVLWNINYEKTTQFMPSIKPESIALTMKGNSYLLISSDINGNVEVLDLKTSQIVTSFHTNNYLITVNQKGTLAMQLTSADRQFEYEYAQWDTRTGKQIGETLRIMLSTVFASSQALSQDGKFLFTGGCHGSFSSSIPCAEGIVEMWDGTTGNLIRQFVGHHDFIDALAIDPNLKILASASGSNTTSDPPSIILWDAQTSKKIKTLVGHSGQITSLDFSPDGRYLVSADKNGNIMLWDMTKSSITNNNGEISDAFFRADGKQLATMSCTFIFGPGIGNCETILWSFPILQQIGVSLLSQVGTSTVAFRDGGAIAADYRDGEIMLWDFNDWKKHLSFANTNFKLRDGFYP